MGKIIKMKIIQVYSPLFTYNDIDYSVETRMFESFTDFDTELKRQNKRGYTHCFFYNVTNVDLKGELIHPMKTDNIDIHFFRYKLLDLSDSDYLPDLTSPPTLIKHIL